MIDITIAGEKGFIKCNISGRIVDLLSDTMLAVKLIHKCIGEKDSEAADLYKKIITENIHLAFMDSSEMQSREEEAKEAKKKFDYLFQGATVQDLQNLCNNLERLSKKFSEEDDE